MNYLFRSCRHKILSVNPNSVALLSPDDGDVGYHSGFRSWMIDQPLLVGEGEDAFQPQGTERVAEPRQQLSAGGTWGGLGSPLEGEGWEGGRP